MGFIENDQKENLIEILKENKTIISGLFNIYHVIGDSNKKLTKNFTLIIKGISI